MPRCAPHGYQDREQLKGIDAQCPGNVASFKLMLPTHQTLPVVLTPGDDGWLVATCPVLPGCVSQGKTRAEALANIREAIELCLEAGDRPAEYVTITVAA